MKKPTSTDGSGASRTQNTMSRERIRDTFILSKKKLKVIYETWKIKTEGGFINQSLEV